MRAASIIDSFILLSWRNSLSARESSQSSHKIELEEHEKWLKARIDRHHNEPFWIFSMSENLVGYVRFEVSKERPATCNVSIFVAEEYQGRGLGKKMLNFAFLDLVSKSSFSEIRAVIRKNNFRSKHLFTSFGFVFSKQLDSNFSEYLVLPNNMNLHEIHF